MSHSLARTRLLRVIIWIILLAAVGSAPVFLVAESFDLKHILAVAASNGVTALLCLLLLHRLRRGTVRFAAPILVYGLLILVAWLASTNGEDVHVNVVNFVLVTVIASMLLDAPAFGSVVVLSAGTMLIIAWRQTVPVSGETLMEARLESIAQFLPTYLVISAVLGFRERLARESATDRA